MGAGIRGPSPTDVADVMAFAPSPPDGDNWDAGTVTAGVYISTTDGVYLFSAKLCCLR